MESSTENVISILFVENQRKRIEREKLNFVTEIPLSNMFLLFRDRPTFGMLWHCQSKLADLTLSSKSKSTKHGPLKPFKIPKWVSKIGLL